MERLVQLLKGDEPKIAMADDEDEDVEGDLMVESLPAEKLKEDEDEDI